MGNVFGLTCIKQCAKKCGCTSNNNNCCGTTNVYNGGTGTASGTTEPEVIYIDKIRNDIDDEKDQQHHQFVILSNSFQINYNQRYTLDNLIHTFTHTVFLNNVNEEDEYKWDLRFAQVSSDNDDMVCNVSNIPMGEIKGAKIEDVFPHNILSFMRRFYISAFKRNVIQVTVLMANNNARVIRVFPNIDRTPNKLKRAPITSISCVIMPPSDDTEDLDITQFKISEDGGSVRIKYKESVSSNQPSVYQEFPIAQHDITHERHSGIINRSSGKGSHW